MLMGAIKEAPQTIYRVQKENKLGLFYLLILSLLDFQDNWWFSEKN